MAMVLSRPISGAYSRAIILGSLPPGWPVHRKILRLPPRCARGRVSGGAGRPGIMPVMTRRATWPMTTTIGGQLLLQPARNINTGYYGHRVTPSHRDLWSDLTENHAVAVFTSRRHACQGKHRTPRLRT